MKKKNRTTTQVSLNGVNEFRLLRSIYLVGVNVLIFRLTLGRKSSMFEGQTQCFLKLQAIPVHLTLLIKLSIFSKDGLIFAIFTAELCGKLFNS